MATTTPRHQCPGGCGLACPKRSKARSVPTTVTTYKTPGVPGMGRWLTVSVLPPSNRGRNARGTTGSKRGWGSGNAKHAKRAKRQGAERMGRVPRIARTNPYPV